MPVDCEKGEGVDLAKQFKIGAYPTFVLANKEIKTIYRFMGYERDYFLETIKTAMADLSTMADKEVRFAENPDAPTAEILAKYSESTGDLLEAVEYYEEARKLNKDPGKDYYLAIFESKNWGFGKKLFTFEDIKQSADLALKSPNTEKKDKFIVLYYMTYQLKSYPQDEQLLGYLKQAKQMTVGDAKLASERRKSALDISSALFLEKDEKKAVELKQSSMAEGWKDNPSELNSYAWWCFQNKVDLEAAETLALKGAELAEENTLKAMILDTAAEIAGLKGDYNKAVKIMEEAISFHPGRKAYQKQLEKFKALSATK